MAQTKWKIVDSEITDGLECFSYLFWGTSGVCMNMVTFTIYIYNNIVTHIHTHAYISHCAYIRILGHMLICDTYGFSGDIRIAQGVG